MPTQRPLVMRIITRLAGGGPPVHATLLNRQMDQHGFDSVLVFGTCGAKEQNMEYLIEKGDRVERVDVLGARPSPVRDLLAVYRLWLLFRRYRPSIVHTHTAKAGFLGRIAALLAGIPCVIHTYHGHVLDGYFAPWANRLIRCAERWLGRVSTALCTVSQQQAAELSGRFEIAPEEKFHVVPLGLTLEPYLAIPSPDFHSERLTLAWLGRFVPIKNLGLLSGVAAACQERKLPIDFLIAGDGPERKDFEEQIRSLALKNVQLLPWQEDVGPVLERAHLLILTSHREGTPLSLIQGMAAGRPFLSTAAGGTVDLAVGVGRLETKSWWYENAVLVSPEIAAFLPVIERLLCNRRQLEAMSAASRSFAQSVFSETRLVADVAALYTELLTPGQSGPHPVLEAKS
ncbi:glycosyltransferase [Bryobacter aggregatus]|uniref:glycosyltransferase n=1 Tax=Bryobacter aggregatus TaxID=360054 RepID=UPI0004E2870D|nr:glycosyltransferase [Bryobacter aggregatus]